MANTERRLEEKYADIKEGEAKKLIESLQFKNPGPQLKGFTDFNPEESTRELRKLNRLCSSNSSLGKGNTKRTKRAVHDKSGRLISNHLDLCDCQDTNCPGCHFPCSSCGSEKCGVECRCGRSWTYCKDVVTVDPYKVSPNDKDNSRRKMK